MSKGRSWNLLHPPYLSKFASLSEEVEEEEKEEKKPIEKVGEIKEDQNTKGIVKY